MNRDDQAAAIWKALDLSIVNEQFDRYVRAVIALAAMAFDDALLEPCRVEAISGWTPRHWALLKGELDQAIQDSGIDPKAQVEWSAAFEAVYRIMGSAEIVPDYGGVF